LKSFGDFMKVGDLVRPIQHNHKFNAPLVEEDWVGMIIDFTHEDPVPAGVVIVRGEKPIVYWNPEFSSEIEYPDQIEVIND
jgi:hypothetical protein